MLEELRNPVEEYQQGTGRFNHALNADSCAFIFPQYLIIIDPTFNPSSLFSDCWCPELRRYLVAYPWVWIYKP